MSGGAEEKKKTATNTVQVVQPGTFESEHHFYQKALNAQIHPLVSFFLSMDNETMIRRYCHLHPGSSAEELRRLLTSKPNHFQWSGADLFNVTTAGGDRHMVVIETNSCPSGQKSMPLADPCEARGGYWKLANKTFKPMLEEKQREGKLVEGALAVLFDKNKMECTGYAAALADAFQETVYLVEWFHEDEDDSTVRLNAEGVIEIADPSNPSVFIPLRAAFRYMTQKPWSRFPLDLCKTVLFNPIIACLAGGRNKALASKAYEVLNEELAERSAGISIKAPLTIRDVKKERLAEMVKDFGGHAVVKVPYSNAGQGVYTITNDEEMKDLLEDIDVAGGSYDNFIVQSLIGNFSWTSDTREGKFFHVGSMPDKKGGIYVSDLRMLIHFDYSVGAFRPIGGYARRARDPLVDKLEPHMDSWSMLGTNLSVKKGTNSWDTETSRLLLLDQKDFNCLGVSVDDLIDAFFQATLSTLAIDHMASRLIAPSSSSSPLPFNLDLFSSLNHDPSLINEIRITQ